MKRVITAVHKFFWNLWNFRKNRGINRLNNKLEKTVKRQEAEKIMLMRDISKFLRKYLKKDASGKYIPLSGKNRAEIYEAVMVKYGTDMKKVNVQLTRTLKFK